VPCSSFNAFKCACPEGTYLSAEDGCSCINCCPSLYTPKDLVFGETHYDLKIKKNPNNHDPQDALLGSGINIQVPNKARYRIQKLSLAFHVKQICFGIRNVKKVKFTFKDGDLNLLDKMTENNPPAMFCLDKEITARRVEIKFFAQNKNDDMTILDLKIQACIPIPM